eukprot:TRINITY_DN65448_c0_g1_i1.p2 TRINITY_DN65448_c0_g1~~TRINITY_DN65448_c0_g1_i1.p2  ORF type:complete len:190 (+),score=55.81 TRINITY_DN65448_c0_g1_i1:87-572(+)
MTLKVGDRVPDGVLMTMSKGRPAPIRIAKHLAGRTVIIFGVPGAFTPTCSARHLPGFVEGAAKLRAKGVDEVICVSVNDCFVMGAWGEHAGAAAGPVTMAADGSAEWTKQAGLELDLTAKGMGMRCQRFVLVARDGMVQHIAVDKGGQLRDSAASAVLARL